MFYKPTKNKIFVSNRVVFHERGLISHGTSGSLIEFGEIKDPTNEEPEVSSRPQQEVEQPVEKSNVLPPPPCRSDREPRPLEFYGFHITQDDDNMLGDKERHNNQETMVNPEATK